jgi:hypothetical protein
MRVKQHMLEVVDSLGGSQLLIDDSYRILLES